MVYGTYNKTATPKTSVESRAHACMACTEARACGAMEVRECGSVEQWKAVGWKHGAESPQEARPGSTNTKARAHTQTLLDRRVPKTERRPSHFHGRL